MKALKAIKYIGYISLVFSVSFILSNLVTEKEIVPPYVTYPLLGIALAWIVFEIVLSVKSRKTRVKMSDVIREKEDAELNREFEIFKTRAEVVDMACSVKQLGIKMPRTVKEFVICFRYENGETHNIYVDEEMYAGFEVGQIGELTLIDGELSTYELDSDIIH